MTAIIEHEETQTMPTSTAEEIQRLTSQHTEAQESRRAIEREIAEVENGIRVAIGTGQADDVLKLNARRRELPGLLVEASGVEAACAVALYRAHHQRTYELVEVAQSELDEVEVAFKARKSEVEKELAALEAGVGQARAKLDAITNEHNTWSQHYAKASRGYLRAIEETAKAI